MKHIINAIEQIWHDRESILSNSALRPQFRDEIKQAIDYIDAGILKSAEKYQGSWRVNSVVQKAILLYFMTNKSKVIQSNHYRWYDKIDLKYVEHSLKDFEKYNTRHIPGSIVRKGAYIGQDTVIMPSFINIGAYIDSGSMIDSNVTIGSCAMIGKNCHVSAGVDIGGVLEPIGSKPVIIEDNCFIGSGVKILEGVIVEENSVLGAGLVLSGSTKIVYRDTGKIVYDVIPKNSVVVPGSIGGDSTNIPSLSCAVIIKSTSKNVKDKTAINDILRSE